jgi:hypothetical protein
MRLTALTVDFAGILLAIGCVLLAVGTIPFSPVWVAVLIFLAKTELSLTTRPR